MTFPEMIHGKKPEVAPFEPTDPLEELAKLLSGEIKNWPQISQLGDLFQQDVFSKLSAAGLDFRNIIGLGSENVQQTEKNALALQKGQLPPEDIAAIQRNSAFQNLGSGLMGSAMGGANALRNIGVGTLDAMGKGAQWASEAGNAAQRWMQMAMGTVLPASSQLYTPDWFTKFMADQRAAKQATQQMRNNVAAAPDPVVSGIAGTVMNLVGAYLGAGRGGGGGNMLATSDPNAMANAEMLNQGQGFTSTNRTGFLGMGPTQTVTAGPLEDTTGYNSTLSGVPQSYAAPANAPMTDWQRQQLTIGQPYTTGSSAPVSSFNSTPPGYLWGI